MASITITDNRGSTSFGIDTEAKKALLLEQIGTTGGVSKSSVFSISLPTGASEGIINPLPDYE